MESKIYNERAGVESTLSQEVRALVLRQSRYRGLAKTRLQHIAIAAAVNLDRLGPWLMGERPRSKRVSRFAPLAGKIRTFAVIYPLLGEVGVYKNTHIVIPITSYIAILVIL